MRTFLLLLLLASMALARPSMAQSPVVSTPESREAVSLTVYNGNFAIVREVRTIPLRRGLVSVRFEGVPAQIDATSIAVKSLTEPGALSVREQNYQFNLIGTNTVLDAAVGQPIRLIRQIGDNTVVETGRLISQPGQGRIVQLDDGRILVDPTGTIELAQLPDGLLSRPSLLWQLNSGRVGDQRVEASYLTNGINWKSDYVAIVSGDESKVDLTGWVTLTNNSGGSYEDAQLQLMAGEVRRVQPNMMLGRAMQADAMYEMAAPMAAPQEESFFEYHLYTFPNPTNIMQRETKQLELLSAAEVGVNRRLIFDGSGTYFPFYRASRPGGAGTEMNAAIVLSIDNSERNNMGMPLPAGTVRVYKQDARGNLQFIGEDSIDHTARNEEVSLYIGDAFDVVGTRREVTNRRISDNEREITIEVEVRNRKETAVEVDVVERVFWGDWQITQTSHPNVKLDARTAQFHVRLGADEKQTVRYTARLKS